jgi:hypothetical protein
MEVKFDWYSLDKPCLVSTICVREYSNVSTTFQKVQYWMCEMLRISAVSTSFWTYGFDLPNLGRKLCIFPSHLDGSQKHIELGRNRSFDFCWTIEVKFDWYSLDKPCLVSTICIREYSNVSTSFQTVQYWMFEMHRISSVSTSFRTYGFDLQN